MMIKTIIRFGNLVFLRTLKRFYLFPILSARLCYVTDIDNWKINPWISRCNENLPPACEISIILVFSGVSKDCTKYSVLTVSEKNH